MQPTGRGDLDPARFTAPDNLAWHPATRAVGTGIPTAGGAADEAALSASMRLVARLEEETHTLTTQLAYLQALLQQVKDTLTVLQTQAASPPVPAPARDQRGRLLSQRIASAAADSYHLPSGTRR